VYGLCVCGLCLADPIIDVIRNSHIRHFIEEGGMSDCVEGLAKGGFAIMLLNDVRNSTTSDTVAMAMKFQTKTVITRLVCQISLRSLGVTGFSVSSYQRMSVDFYNANPGCHGNEI